MPFPGDMNWSFFLDRRVKQLDTEAKLDDLLLIANKECPYETSQFLLDMRRLNRVESTKIYRAPFYNMPSMFSAYMAQVDAIHVRVLTQPVCNFCKELQTIHNELIKKS